MIAKAFALATFIAGGIILADLVANVNGTNALANAFISTEKVSANALLGKTS